MPRRAPDTVTEHRLTLGNIERSLAESASARDTATQDQAQQFRNYAEGVAALMIPMTIIGVGVLGVKVYADVREAVDGININPFNKPLNSETNLTLGQVLFGSSVPKPITGDKVQLVDLEGAPVEPPTNPLAGTPVGGLFGLGMRIGQTFNPFTRWA